MAIATLGAAAGSVIGEALKSSGAAPAMMGSSLASGVVRAAMGGNWTAVAVATIGNVVAESVVQESQGPSQSELELQQREDARDAEMARLLGENPNLGRGLTVPLAQAAGWGPKFAAQSNDPYHKADYSLVPLGQRVFLPRIEATPYAQVDPEAFDQFFPQKSLYPEYEPLAGDNGQAIPRNTNGYVNGYKPAQSAGGLKGFMEGLSGSESVMETPTTTKTLGGYLRTGGQLLNTMFNPKEIAHGMWDAIDSGNPLEIGMTALGFVPVGIAGKAGAVERALLQAEVGGANATSIANRLKYLGDEIWESPLGLKYGPDIQYGNRIQHVLRHTEDQPLRLGDHGVFDVGLKNVVGMVDEAWSIARQGGAEVTASTVGNKTIYTVEMGRRVGWIGGQGGAELGNPATNSIRLVIRNGNRVVTAYPVR